MTSINLTRKAVAPSKVYCKVDDSSGPIAPGDRLVPSTTTFGHAMKAADANRDSTVIGEALAPFDGGCGLIPVAVTEDHLALILKRLTKPNRQGKLFYRLLNHC
ncbi:hypothetical protein [Williamsia sp.]|uniref:hypothetical protein n=1 Tax=Williamsia sp. TaxID=1872085 RepID=UPI002F948C9B